MNLVTFPRRPACPLAPTVDEVDLAITCLSRRDDAAAILQAIALIEARLEQCVNRLAAKVDALTCVRCGGEVVDADAAPFCSLRCACEAEREG